MWLLLSVAHATQTVDGSTLTLKQAIANSSADPYILIDPAYDVTVEGPLIIEKPVTISSWTAETHVMMPAVLVYGTEVIFNDLEFLGTTDEFTLDSNGSTIECQQCGLYVLESALTGTRIKFDGSGGGSAPFWIEGSEATLSGLSLTNIGAPNTMMITRGDGGTDVVIQNCTVTDNAGPIRVDSEVSSDISVVIDDCTFEQNSSSEPSDAPDVHVANVAHIQIEDSTFEDSNGGTGAGSIYIKDAPSTQLQNLTFKRTSGGTGGALRVHSDNIGMTPWIAVIDILGASATADGGGLHLEGQYLDAEISDLRVVDTSGRNGGALFVDSARVACSNCGLFGTQASQAGGGVATTGNADVELKRTWICGAQSSAAGSAIQTDNGSLSMENTVVQDPRGAASALELTGNTAVLMDHVDLLGRNGTVAIGGAHGDFTMTNTIISGWGIWADGSVNGARSIMWNLWDGGTSTVDVQPTADDIEADPEFVDEFELGDCTTIPMLDALVPSPAIDAGGPADCQDWDGDAPCDIGAFGGPGGKPDQAPWSEGWDGNPAWEDTGDSGPIESPPWESPVDSPQDSDSGQPTGDTGTPQVPEPVTFVTGGCRTGAAFLVLLGLGLAARRR